MKRRASGILLHVTSLPAAYGIGDLGPAAYRFVEFLAGAGQAYWQILPLNPTEPIHGNSPYNSVSAFAGTPLLISPDFLVRDGLLSAEETDAHPDFPPERVDYPAAIAFKERLLDRAYDRFFGGTGARDEYDRFCSEHSYWLDDFSLFTALRGRLDAASWSDWPEAIRDRAPEALLEARAGLSEPIEKMKFFQYLFFRQWLSLKDYCKERGIRVIGDLPIYVNYDSVDVWSRPDLFRLDQDKRPEAVAGVPPDYFSATGQLWGNPLYHWERLEEAGFEWWVRRMERSLGLFDLVRIDHFRGLVGYWEVPVSESTALNGRWVKAPADAFLKALRKRFPRLPVIAEDLGIITPDVREVMDRFGLPGMKVLLFAFGEEDPDHPYLPHTYEENCVAYTGTHDTNTLRGWFERETTPEIRERIYRYIGCAASAEEIPWELTRLAMESPARLAIIPMQDVLALGKEARMNDPATRAGNWRWRLLQEQLTPSVAEKLSRLTKASGRS